MQPALARWGLATLAGLLLSASWYAPLTLSIFVALAPLLALERSLAQSPGRRNGWAFFGYSLWAMLLWNVGAIWWLWNASGWATLGAWIANALLQTLPLLAYRRIRLSTQNRFGVLAFAGSWVAFEYLHLHWDFSWPWLHLGNAFGPHPAWVQWYEYTGAFGGSCWVLCANWLAYYFLFGKQPRIAVSWALVVLPPLAFSGWMWMNHEEQGPLVEVVAVQPNLDCYTEKFSYNSKTGERNQASQVPYSEQVARLVRLTEQAITPQTQWALWPETALHQGIDEANPWAHADLQAARALARRHPRLAVLTGADTHRRYARPEEHTPTTRYYEGYGHYDKFGSAVLVDSSEQAAFYHKSKLVIGVETIPFPALLKPLLLNFGGTAGGLGRQAERAVFSHGEGKAAPVICYESVYGEFVAEYVRQGADFIAIVTNDGWWGNTAGHRQHLHYASLRAIEMRRAVARSANTGVSAFISQRGEIVSETAYDEETALRGTVALNRELTVYAQWGDYLGRLLAFLTAFMLLSAWVKRKIA